MKKSYLMIAVAATLFAACSSNDSFKEITTQEDSAITFTTFTSKQTRADNSSATATNALQAYNNTFRLWGNKYIKNGETSFARTPVFGFTRNATNGYEYPGEEVEYKSTAATLIGNWTYSPVRFWDKTATHYDFYAAAPFLPKSAKYENNAWTTEDKTWVIDDTKSPKTISLANFRVSGTNMASDPTNTTIDAAKVMATVDTEDLMIASDILEYKDYTYSTTPNQAGVQLVFNHILSRLNIGFRKSDDLAGFTVKLNSVSIYNMKSIGSFNEYTTLTAEQLKAGTQARWTKDDSNADKFTPGKMLFDTPTEIAQTVTDAKYQYVYEGLIIPQTVGYAKTVMPNEDVTGVTSYLRIDGYNAVSSGDVTWSDPYIVIDYEIGNTDNNSTYSKIDGYKYYFNLADVFNGTAETAVDFCEGWQNTLNITLAPSAIKFNPVVYNWDEKYPTGDANLDGEFTVQ